MGPGVTDPEIALFASSGEILEYTHQLAGDTLTIWFGDTEPPAKFVGTFDAEATA